MEGAVGLQPNRSEAINWYQKGRHWAIPRRRFYFGSFKTEASPVVNAPTSWVQPYDVALWMVGTT